MAEWLDTVFCNFDYSILEGLHNIALSADNILNPICSILNTIGTFPLIITVWIGVFAFFFTKEKKLGMYLIGATFIGYIISVMVIKDLVARARPYSLDLYKDWFNYVGAFYQEGDPFSFPSGHATAAMAGITGFFIWSKNKKVSWLAFIYVIIMGLSRNYLMLHYPSDVIGGMIVGLISAIIAHYIIKLIYWWCNKYQNNFVSRFILTGSFKKSKA